MTASALATAGGVVFGGTADRQFFALDADSGKLLWQTRLNGDVSGSPISFTVGGRQFVAITAGGRTGPTTSFGPLTGVNLSDGTGVVWVFAVPGDTDVELSRGPRRPVIRSTSGVTTPSPQPAPAPLATIATATGMFTSPQAIRGEERFRQACSTCHSIEEQAGSLRAKWGSGTLADLFKVIATTMPQNSPGSLTPEDYASIIAFYLRQSGHSPGSSELPSDPALLARMRLSP
jgi:alcohol dehydrogenase (cytochrome c)